MKFAFCLYKYFPFGGLQRDMLQIAEECTNRGHQVDCYVRKWEGDKPEWLNLYRCPVQAVTNIGKDAVFIRKLHKKLNHSQYDRVVAFNRIPGCDFYYAADPCFRRQIKDRSRMYRLSRRCRYRLNWEKQIFDPGTRTHAILLTEQQKNFFQSFYGTPDEQCHVLPPVLNKERLQHIADPDAANQFRKEFQIRDNQIVLLGIASAFHVKGVDRTLRALAALPDNSRQKVVYIVAGSGRIAKYIKLAEHLGVRDLCHFVGGRDDVPYFYAAADLFIHPARTETSGTALLEAVAAGLPTITTDVCGYAPYVEEAEAGFVLSEPFDQQAFNDTLSQLLSAPDQRAQFAANGREIGRRPEFYQGLQTAAHLIESAHISSNGK